MTLPITALTAAICAIMLLITAIDTVRQRIKGSVAFGDGGGDHPKLVSAMRSHANLAEHAPIVILMIGVLESAHAHHWALTAIATTFLAGRALHIIGLYAPVNAKPPLPRSLGVILTWVTMAALIGWILVMVVMRNG